MNDGGQQDDWSINMELVFVYACFGLFLVFTYFAQQGNDQFCIEKGFNNGGSESASHQEYKCVDKEGVVHHFPLQEYRDWLQKRNNS